MALTTKYHMAMVTLCSRKENEGSIGSREHTWCLKCDDLPNKATEETKKM